jgi:hypothetical protein
MCMFTEALDEPELTPEEIKQRREERQSFIAHYLSDESFKARRESHSIALKEAMDKISPDF